MTGLISKGGLGSNDCVEEDEEEDMLSLLTKDLGEEISPVSIQRSSAGEEAEETGGGWGCGLTVAEVLGTGQSVTPELGGGMSETLLSF